MPREFVYARRVQFAETDMAGVMHFANYYRIMEEAEHAFWRSLGLSVHTVDHAAEIGWPRVATSCQYFAPARFEDELQVRLRLVDVGQKTVEFEFEFRREDTRIAFGKAKAVCCTMVDRAFQSIPIPEDVRARLLGDSTDSQ
ncbi:MAG: acyl-CoA thioesterase [Planctomycetes bacterium]|nr:acyl-CoA thioesterase [Planctomycetota bacterium]